MSENDVISLLKRSKVYIDFGHHPGKDRFPRESAILKNCVITNTRGSSDFYNDVPLDPSYKTDNIELVGPLIRDCLQNFDKHLDNFSMYRSIIKNEKDEFYNQCGRYFIQDSKQDTIKSIINKIGLLDVENLNESEIERIIPEYGMNDENLNEMPSELNQYYGKGIKFWQYPNQFSKFLKFIYNKKIDSYLEIGCRWGGTFIIINEILRKRNPNLRSFTCDLISASSLMNLYSSIHDFKYIQGNSNDQSRLLEQLPEQIDFVFIDGDHSKNGVTKDYETALKLNPRYIMFHDISSDVCSDLGNFWNEIKYRHSAYYEFIEQYKSVKGSFLGIGIIEL
jgi:hypothetical protein